MINIDTTSNDNFYLPVLGFLKNESLNGDIEEIIKQGTCIHTLNLTIGEADDYFLEIQRGIFYHVAVYLGKGYICHFSGDKTGSF